MVKFGLGMSRCEQCGMKLDHKNFCRMKNRGRKGCY